MDQMVYFAPLEVRGQPQFFFFSLEERKVNQAEALPLLVVSHGTLSEKYYVTVKGERQVIFDPLWVVHHLQI